MNILFLDDSLERGKFFRSRNPSCIWVENVKDAIFELRSRKWDRVWLDHDLNGEAYVDSGREDCGMEVVRFLEKNKLEIGLIYVHTLNEPAAKEMVLKLKSAGYNVIRYPFLSYVAEAM